MKKRKERKRKPVIREGFLSTRLIPSELACLRANALATGRSVSTIVRQLLGSIIAPVAGGQQ